MRVRRRLVEGVSRQCAVMSIWYAANDVGLNWRTVRNIVKRSFDRRLGPVNFKRVTLIGMDEFAIRHGHRDGNVVIEPVHKRALWGGRELSWERIWPSFAPRSPSGCGARKAMVMDMNGALEQEVRAQAPQAQIVYDLSHVVAKFGREVIGRVRIDEANRFRADLHARHLVKGRRWLPRCNRENVTSEADQVRLLRELPDDNRVPIISYALKDDLKELWRLRHEGNALVSGITGIVRGMCRCIEPLKMPAPKLPSYLPGLLVLCRYPLHTCVFEGMNNKITVIKRMAYGFRDGQNFFLTIRAAFPRIS